MEASESIPDLDHIAHYCKPWSVVDGMPTEKSFKVQPKGASDMSWNWLEFLSLDRKAAMTKLRTEAGAMTPEEGSCYAVTEVGRLKQLLTTFPGKDYNPPKVLHTPIEDNRSHVSVLGDGYNIGEKVVRLAMADMMTADDIEPGLEPQE